LGFQPERPSRKIISPFWKGKYTSTIFKRLPQHEHDALFPTKVLKKQQNPN